MMNSKLLFDENFKFLWQTIFELQINRKMYNIQPLI